MLSAVAAISVGTGASLLANTVTAAERIIEYVLKSQGIESGVALCIADQEGKQLAWRIFGQVKKGSKILDLAIHEVQRLVETVGAVAWVWTPELKSGAIRGTDFVMGLSGLDTDVIQKILFLVEIRTAGDRATWNWFPIEAKNIPGFAELDRATAPVDAV